MESNTKIDNKRLTKILFITGFGLLLLFIIVRLISKAQGDQITDMPTVGELTYNPKKIEEQSKVEQFEEERNEKQRKEMGLDENNYIVPSFHELTGNEKDNTKNEENKNVVANNEIPRSGYENYTNINSKPVQQSNNNTNSKLSFHSDYYNAEKNQNVEAEEPVQEQATAPVQRNPFGTIFSDSPVQKEATAGTSYYSGEIYGDQKIENGEVVIIRNTQVITGPPTIPQNSILYGQASFQGNRVFIKINRAKTKSGEYTVNFTINDNDRIEGIYFKAPIDETVDKTKEETEIPAIPGTYGKLINTVSNTALKAGKELMKKGSTLHLEEGYKIFIVPIKQN